MPVRPVSTDPTKFLIGAGQVFAKDSTLANVEYFKPEKPLGALEPGAGVQINFSRTFEDVLVSDARGVPRPAATFLTEENIEVVFTLKEFDIDFIAEVLGQSTTTSTDLDGNEITEFCVQSSACPGELALQFEVVNPCNTDIYYQVDVYRAQLAGDLSLSFTNATYSQEFTFKALTSTYNFFGAAGFTDGVHATTAGQYTAYPTGSTATTTPSLDYNFVDAPVCVRRVNENP